jgi:hypothetical protein
MIQEISPPAAMRALDLAAHLGRTFVGYYITDEGVQKIADDYYLITAALELVNFPIILPYTKLLNLLAVRGGIQLGLNPGVHDTRDLAAGSHAGLGQSRSILQRSLARFFVNSPTMKLPRLSSPSCSLLKITKNLARLL